MSEETNTDLLESDNANQSTIVRYSSKLVERTIERALDVIYEQVIDMEPELHEWRHSVDKIPIADS